MVAHTVLHGNLLLGDGGRKRVGPEALKWTSLRGFLLVLGHLGGAGIQHGLQDPSSRVNKPWMREMVPKVYILCFLFIFEKRNSVVPLFTSNCTI